MVKPSKLKGLLTHGPYCPFQDLSPELAAMLLATVIGGYTLIGGLGATFYVSYFNTALIFVLILMLVVEVFYNPFQNPENPFGDATKLYDFISCWKAPNGNRDESYLTFFSPGANSFSFVSPFFSPLERKSRAFVSKMLNLPVST